MDDMSSGDHSEHMAAIDLVDPSDATHVAVQSGDWFDPATWAGGAVPDNNARVYIPETLSVTYAGISDTLIFSIGVAGELVFDPTQDSRLVVDTMVVVPTGRLEIGTVDNPVPADVSVDIVIAHDSATNGAIDTVWDPQLLSRGIVSLGAVEIHGAEKDAHTKVVADPMIGDTSITLASGGDGWQVGDTIVIAGTQNKGYWGIGNANRTYEGDTNEVRVITAIDGNTVHFADPLDYDHPSPRDDLKTSVANYTRSITIRSEDGADSAVYERGHVMFMASQDVDVRYAAFEELGRTDKSVRSTPVSDLETVSFDSNVQGRYSLHLHQLGVENQRDPIIIEGNAVVGGPGWGIAQHSSHANLQNNATFDIFGASYVAEAGNETGSWIDNISIGNEGVYNIERQHDDVAAFDLGRTGNGFWLQSRMVETVDNIAAAARTGFVWVAQGSPEGIEPATFDQPEALGLAEATLPRDLPITLSHGNEVFGSERGLTVTKGDPNQGHDVRSVLEDFTAWEVRSGVNVEYTSHYTFVNFDLIAAEHNQQYAWVEAGFHYGNNVSDMVIVDTSVVGFEYAYDFSDFFSGSLGATQDQKQFFVVSSTAENLRAGLFAQDDWAMRTIVLDEVPNPDATLSVNMDPLVIGAGVSYPNIRFTGTKTDSLGDIPIPSGTDTYELSAQDVRVIAETDGYYLRGDKHVMIIEAYYQDRITGELLKVGHMVEAPDLETLGRGSLSGAVYHGEYPETNQPVQVDDDTAQTQAEEEVVVHVLANDNDTDAIGTLTVDGVQQPRNGRVFDNEDGTVSYIPDFGFVGTDRFAYFATDGLGTFERATVTVTVNAAVADAGGEATPETPAKTLGVDAVIRGDAAHDMIIGDAKDEALDGGAGLNRLVGGAGQDVFVFSTETTLDIVYDFSQGEDQIALLDVAFADLTITTYRETDTILTFGAGRMILRDTDVATVDASDFVVISESDLIL